jgi:hypothetical protein
MQKIVKSLQLLSKDVSLSGGVKLTSPAGAVFRNKNTKIGQQNTHQHFFQSCEEKMPKFPDTSNTCYQSHYLAAAELIIRQELYIEFLEWICDGKDKPGFTNMKKNIYAGLTDVPTLTELCVLVLYAQAISHPYMHEVQEPAAKEINILDLGSLHQKVQKHMEEVIAKPEILLHPHGTYKTGSMDSKQWHSLEAVAAVEKLASSLPHLKSALIAFFKEVLST